MLPTTKKWLGLAILASLVCPARGYSQFGGGGFGGVTNRPNGPSAKHVIISGSRALSDELIALVVGSVSQRLEASGKLGEGISGFVLLPLRVSWGDDATVDYLMLSYTPNFAGDPPDDEALSEMWESARRELEHSLQAMLDQQLAGKRNALARDRDSLEADRAQTRVKLDETINRLQELDGASSSPEQLDQQLAAAVSMLRQLQLDRVGADARRKAIEERADDLRASAREETEADPVIGELRKIVAIREEQLANANLLANNAGTISRADVQQIDAELAEARIELLKAQRAAADRSSGAILQEFNNELSKLFVQDAELKARGDALETTVKELSAQASVAVRTEIAGLQQSVKSLRERLASIDDEAAELEDKMQSTSGGEISIRPLEEALAPDAEPANDEKK